MNTHDFKERPVITREVWDTFGYKVLMAGMGDDTAMLIAELYARGLEPDEILFCDTGSEFPHTYRFIRHLQTWCAERNWSRVTVLHKKDKNDQPLSVIGVCEAAHDLPAAAYGRKSCSLRFKAETADKYFNNNPQCWRAWGIKKKGARLDTYTGKILRMIGLNADEEVRVAKWTPEDKWVQAFPLYDWEIGDHESEEVEKVGLYYPGKSSCYICPHLKPHEVRMLRDTYPGLYARAIALEADFRENTMAPQSTTIGLARHYVWSEYEKKKLTLDNLPCECGH